MKSSAPKAHNSTEQHREAEHIEGMLFNTFYTFSVETNISGFFPFDTRVHTQKCCDGLGQHSVCFTTHLPALATQGSAQSSALPVQLPRATAKIKDCKHSMDGFCISAY